MHRITLFAFLMSLALPGAVPAAQAQQAQRTPRGGQPFEGSPLFWQVDTVMQYVASGITRQYNLDATQEDYTRKLLTQRVKRFLAEHERETRTMFAEYMAYQVGGQLPPPEVAREFANRARPMMAAIHKEIMDGNLKWREILNDKQRQIHDRDLEYIDRAFQERDQQFERWSRGQVDPGDFPSMLSRQPRSIMRSEDAWQYYVNRFIQDYRLEPGQQESAQSVLRTLREEAAAYREAHKDDFAQLDARYQEIFASAPKTNPEELEKAKAKRKDLDRRRQELEKPVSVDMFERLKRQLHAIPREDQRQAFTKREQRLKRTADEAREAFAARVATRPALTQPAGTAAATQPAAAEPSASP